MTLSFDSAPMPVPLQHLPFAAAVLDCSGTIVAANYRFARMSGLTESAASGRRLADIVAERDRAAVEEALWNLSLLERREAHARCSLRALRAKPPAIWIAIDMTRLGAESPVPYLACLRAIPRRRSDGPPERRVPARALPSPRSGSEAVAPPDSGNTEPWPALLTTLSHEFRGPLTAIRGWVQMAESGGLSPETTARALTVIARNAESLSDLIDNLFDLSRRTAGSLVLRRRVFDLNPLVQLVVESTLPAARRRNVTLTVRRTLVTLPVNGDPHRLEQVVRNLLENAIKFTPSGGNVRVHTESDVCAEIVVADTGLGIAPDLLPVIFEPFRHDDETVALPERGVGLGLALVRELVQLHEGDVRALSGGPGQGSTFIVRLPLAGTGATRLTATPGPVTR
jgi:PAS domain S-box-containing protein